MKKDKTHWFANFVNTTLGKKKVEPEVQVQSTSEEERRAVLEREKEEATKEEKK